VEEALKRFESAELRASAGWPTHLRRVFWLPIHAWLVYRRCVRELQAPLHRILVDRQAAERRGEAGAHASCRCHRDWRHFGRGAGQGAARHQHRPNIGNDGQTFGTPENATG
jgi:hypothetical protein